MDTLKIAQSYREATKRLLLLDYDGTLAEFATDPQGAAPTAATLDLLRQLAADKRNEVVIISGRDQATLEKWLGKLRVGLVAEHGFFVRPVGGKWRSLADIDDSWKLRARQRMQAAVRALPGSFIEEKRSTMVWHYRAAYAALTSVVSDALLKTLQNLPGKLKAVRGNKILEVSHQAINKGQASSHWYAQGSFDFVLAAGDDTTDEDMFAALPKKAFTIKVGSGRTAARHSVASPAELRQLLQAIQTR